jgi:hypothetical protein
MPVDIHPKEKISGVEIILTRLHAGGKFNDKTYQHAGGLHGVGVSVVNALSKHLECWVRRGGKEYNISFAGGALKSKLEVVGDVAKSKSGTTIRFWPDPKYFDTSSRARRTSGCIPAACINISPRNWARVSGCRRKLFTANGISRAVRSIGPSPGCWSPNTPLRKAM